jgi:tetratricopeptide (TPR) repeat protein
LFQNDLATCPVENADYASAITHALALASQRNWPQALAEVEALLGTYKQDAMALYLLGRIHLSLGNDGQAKELFIRAKDLDPIPWRALSEFNDLIRQEARKPHVHLVDVSKDFENAAAYGIPGFSLVADNCHPTPAGSALIVHSILSKVAALGLIQGFDRMLPDCCKLDTYLETFGDGRKREFLISVLLKNGQYAMKTPFFNYAAARMYFDQVLNLDSDNWVTWANLGSLSLLEGNRQQGLRQLSMAKRLKKAPLDGRDRRSYPYLAEALRAARVAESDIH